VFTAWPSLSLTLPTELDESRPSATYWAGSGRTNFETNELYESGAINRAWRPFTRYCRCADYFFVAYRIALFAAYCSVFPSRIVPLRSSRIAPFCCRVPSRFFSRVSHCLCRRVSSRSYCRVISFCWRIPYSRVSSRLRFAYGSIFVSRIVPFSFRVSFYVPFSFRISFYLRLASNSD